MAPAVPEGVVEHGTGTERADVLDEVLARTRGPVALGEPAGFASPPGEQQRLEATAVGVLHEVQLVVGGERIDAGHQPMVGGGHLDLVGGHGRVGDELAAEGLRKDGEAAGRLDAVGPGQVQRRVGAVQRHPPTALLHPGAQSPLGPLRGPHIAGVAHQQAASVQTGSVLVGGIDPGAHVGMLGQQAEQLAAGEIDVVVLAAGHQAGVDAPLSWRFSSRHA